MPSASAQPAPPSNGAGRAGTDSGGSDRAALELTSIVRDQQGGERANIIVDGESYRPARGDVFSYGYRLEGVDGNCVEVSAGQEWVRMCLPTTTEQS